MPCLELVELCERNRPIQAISVFARAKDRQTRIAETPRRRLHREKMVSVARCAAFGLLRCYRRNQNVAVCRILTHVADSVIQLKSVRRRRTQSLAQEKKVDNCE